MVGASPYRHCNGERNQAASDRCVAHGLRKAACRRLAEAGATAKQIAAISGHKTLALVQLYTEKAEQTVLADSAMAKLSNRDAS